MYLPYEIYSVFKIYIYFSWYKLQVLLTYLYPVTSSYLAVYSEGKTYCNVTHLCYVALQILYSEDIVYCGGIVKDIVLN